MLRNLTIVVVLLMLFFSAKSQNFNRPVPYGVFPYEYVQHSSDFDFHLSLNMFHIGQNFSDPDYDFPRGMILDPDGYLAWYQDSIPSDVRGMNNLHYSAEHKVFLETVIYPNNVMKFRTLDTLMQFTDSVMPVSVDPDAHELLLTSSNERYIITQIDSVFDLSSYTINGSPGNASTTVRCNGIQGFDVAGNLIFDWNSCDHVHPSEAYGFNYNPNDYDYFHMNSVEMDGDGNLIASGRHTNSVIKIDGTTGDVIWRLGGINSDFTMVDNEWFSGQHDARDLGNGLISIHDNGNLVTPKKSRGLIYELDTVNWTATLVSNFDPTPSVYGRAMGSHRKIGDFGVVSYGRILRPDPSVLIYDNAMDIAAEYYFQDSIMTYRTLPFHIDFEFPRPTITCFDSLGQTYLKSTTSAANYIWSSGENTEAIVPTIGETYQVYTPYGVGRIGSFPYTYDGNCSELSLKDLTEENAPELTGSYDLLGRKVNIKKSGTVYIDVYSNGESKLNYYSE